MQQGLPAAYDYSDFLYVVAEGSNLDKLASLGTTNFRQELAVIIVKNFKDYVHFEKRLRNIPEIPQLLISTFDTELWNKLSTSTVQVYKPAWNDPQRSKILHEGFPDRKKNFYKFDTKILFQIKKNIKGANPLTTAVENLLTKHGLSFYKIQGESR